MFNISYYYNQFVLFLAKVSFTLGEKRIDFVCRRIGRENLSGIMLLLEILELIMMSDYVSHLIDEWVYGFISRTKTTLLNEPMTEKSKVQLTKLRRYKKNTIKSLRKFEARYGF